jgi:hypothetical protein
MSRCDSTRPDIAVAKAGEGAVLEEVKTAIAGIRFGSVEIVIHDSKVVLITRTEKIKLPPDGAR